VVADCRSAHRSGSTIKRRAAPAGDEMLEMAMNRRNGPAGVALWLSNSYFVVGSMSNTTDIIGFR
jgi:hypothetical protein